ncbi:unnamed protein product [Heligmosomoides polygyrus]|uniref:Uncharacterized protein n=1 Tax=Heligmosomoides polygyrus TaxID=6339 RepID=A0A183G309_HELPZ|nr:unnamed protein product [Heligmosomoides polygyrus]
MVVAVILSPVGSPTFPWVPKHAISLYHTFGWMRLARCYILPQKFWIWHHEQVWAALASSSSSSCGFVLPSPLLQLLRGTFEFSHLQDIASLLPHLIQAPDLTSSERRLPAA